MEVVNNKKTFQYLQPKSLDSIKSNNDCMVRATTIALHYYWGELRNTHHYDTIRKVLYEHGWRASIRRQKTSWQHQIQCTLDQLKYKWTYQTFPAKKGKPRMNGVRFTEQYPEGRFILQMAGHVAACVDGVIYDTWDCSNKCVYGAYKIQ